jgi:hypothetical protein
LSLAWVIIGGPLLIIFIGRLCGSEPEDYEPDEEYTEDEYEY